MDKIAYMILLFVFGFFAMSRAIHYFITPYDDLYSHYRNTIDQSPVHFRKRLLLKRILWSISALALLILAFYLFFN